MLRVLLAKDLRRAWRNPLPWLINLIVPLAMTALIGLVFGGKSDGGALGRIRFAVVDEDKSVLTRMLPAAANQGEGGKYLEPVFMDRATALREVNGNNISAVLIIPAHFTSNYLTAREPVSLELIKNPAESIHPAVLEELLGTVVTALNAISRNFNSDFPALQAAFERNFDYNKIALLVERVGDKLKTAGKFINPPLVSYEKDDDVSKDAASKSGKSKGEQTSRPESGKAKTNRGDSGIFAYLLLGLSAMFLLFLANNAMTDLHRELKKRTFERYQTMHQQLSPFIVGKVVFAVVILLLCSLVMLGGGGLIFGIHWRQLLPLMSLTFGYTCFVAALFAVLVALVPDERRAGVLNNIAGMALGLMGGCAFPPNQLPAFVREHITPLLPSYWFVDTARTLQSSSANIPWAFVVFKLTVLSVVLIALAAMLFRRRFNIGLRS